MEWRMERPWRGRRMGRRRMERQMEWRMERPVRRWRLCSQPLHPALLSYLPPLLDLPSLPDRAPLLVPKLQNTLRAFDGLLRATSRGARAEAVHGRCSR